MKKLEIKLIEFAKKLNSRKLSPLRSGNISVRFKKNSTEGFLITPSGIKYEFSKYKKVLFSNNINKACNNADLIIIHTDWEEFKALDFKKLNKKRNFIIYDMRNLYSAETMKKKGLR